MVREGMRLTHAARLRAWSSRRSLRAPGSDSSSVRIIVRTVAWAQSRIVSANHKRSEKPFALSSAIWTIAHKQMKQNEICHYSKARGRSLERRRLGAAHLDVLEPRSDDAGWRHGCLCEALGII